MTFIVLARAWMRNPSKQLIGFVWTAYEDMCAASPPIDPRDLERSITQLLEPRIRAAMSGDEPFYVQHGPYERETMRPLSFARTNASCGHLRRRS